jgi:hypothetical protein
MPVPIGRAILRGTKLAAYAFAGLLACIVIYNVTALPSVPPPEVLPDFDSAADTASFHQLAPTVPPPPPLARPANIPARHSLPKATVVSKVIEDVAPPPQGEVMERAEVIGPALESRTFGEVTPVPDPEVVAPEDAIPGIVIVRPLERERRENRALRWIKSLGDVLKDDSN